DGGCMLTELAYCSAGGHCYRIFGGATSWCDARIKCRSIGWDLAVLDSGQEFDDVRDRLAQSVLRGAGSPSPWTTRTWIGAYRECVDGGTEATYRWVDGSAFAAPSASIDLDNETNARENCIDWGGNTHWHRDLCTDKNLFLCESGAKIPSPDDLCAKGPDDT